MYRNMAVKKYSQSQCAFAPLSVSAHSVTWWE